MSAQVKTPWRNGIYTSDSNTTVLMKVKGQTVDMYPPALLDYPDMDSVSTGTWMFGDFGEAHEEVQKVSGIKNNNVDLSLFHGISKTQGVLCEDGTKIYSWGMWNCIEVLTWQSDEDYQKLVEDRDPIEAPSCHYKIQPENVGKLVWLSGPPGAGKSTTGQLMGKEDGYVYFEADCIRSGLNPFIPLDSDNPLAPFQQKPLKGISKEYIDAIKEKQGETKKFTNGNVDDVDWNKMKPFFTCMAKDVLVQKNRLGGDFVVTHAITSRDMRDHVRTVLPDCIFITLSLSREAQEKRIRERHGEGMASEGILKLFTKLYNLYEGPGDGEKNTYNVDIMEEMTKKDVLDKVLEVLKENC